MNLAALLDGHANHSERGADTSRSQGAGVALRHHAALARHQVRAEAPDSLVSDLLFEMDLLRFRDQRLLDRGKIGSFRAELHEPALHAVERPEKIDASGPGFRQHAANLGKFRLQLA